MTKEIAIIVFAIGWFGFWFVVHDVLARGLYCDWKHKHNNGYRCYFWDCKHYHECMYNGEKRGRIFEAAKRLIRSNSFSHK